MRILLTVLSITLLFSSCKKEDETSPFTHGKMHTNLYPFLFDTGSYWVYKDTITSSLDSMIVTSITKDVYTYPVVAPGQGPPGDEEYFNISYLSYPANAVSTDILMSSNIGTTVPLGYGPIKYICTKNIGATNQGATIESIFDSLNVEGQMYYDVVKMNSQQSSTSAITNYYYYYVENIGVIKKEAYNGTSLMGTWNLLRYNTVMKPYF